MMDGIEAPSFSLGLDFDDPQTQTPLHSDPPQYPKLNRLPRCTGLDFDDPQTQTPLHSDPPQYPKLNSLPRCTDEHLHIQDTAVCTGSKLPPNKIENRNQNVSYAGEPVSTSCSSPVFSKFTVTPLGRFQLIDSDLDSDHPCVNDSDNDKKCDRPVKRRQWNVDESSNLLEKRVCVPTPAMNEFCQEFFGPIKHERNAVVQTNKSNPVTRSSVNVDDSYLPAHRYYFHDDPRIQELVRSRLHNFSPLGNPLNRDLDQPSASNIDYMRQFNSFESSKQSATNTNDKQSSSGRKFSRKSKAEETSEGWVNPKLGVSKATTKRGAKRKVHAARQTPGRWLTGSDGKKVYVGKTGQELTGRVAYMRYKKESGSEFKKGKRKTATKKKKK